MVQIFVLIIIKDSTVVETCEANEIARAIKKVEGIQ